MKVIFLTQYYPPECGAPQTRLSELASLVLKLSHSVTVLTAMPNYPTGKIQEGYGGFVMRETLDGVRIIRSVIYPTQKADFVRRLSNYLSFVLSSAFVGTFCLRRSDYLLVESPPLFLGLSGLWLALLTRSKLIFNVSDLWPESAVQLDLIQRGGLLHHLSGWLEGFLYKRAWLVTGQSKSILQDISGRFPACQTYHLSNGVDTSRFRPDREYPETRKQFGAGGDCLVMYAGLHGLAQGLDQVLEAAFRTRYDRNLKYALVGDGPEKRSLIEQARVRRLDNICFYDPVPSSQMPAVLASADIVLVPLKKHIPGAVPSKLYEAMASGKPVVLLAEGEAREIVEANEAGLVVSPGDAEKLAEAVLVLSRDARLRNRLGANGRRTTEMFFNRNVIVNEFLEYLNTHHHQG